MRRSVNNLATSKGGHREIGWDKGATERKLRIALYSHDTMGIGHMRRNLLIAQTFAESQLPATILLIAGAREASAFAMPPGIDCLTLPSLSKEEDGHYHSRHLDLSLQDLVRLRANVICAAVETLAPDVLIVDKVPRGAGCELDATLRYLRADGHARCVLGLRDILDDPATVRREWRRDSSDDVIREFYDMVWVYGDRAVYDPVREYHFSSNTTAKIRYTGYLDQRKRLNFGETNPAEALADLQLPSGRLIMCVVGGGQDGARLVDAFSKASLPDDAYGIVLTGPFMPREILRSLRRRAARGDRFRVLEFVAEPSRLLRHADRVIAMGGYNTICEVLSFGKPALIVPRVKPRREQLIRAERLRELGLLDMLHPDELSPRALTAWLLRDLPQPLSTRNHVNLNGLALLPHLLHELVSQSRLATELAH
jgi:predicted glycosyltransferase